MVELDALRTRLRERLGGSKPTDPAEKDLLLAGLPVELQASHRPLFPAQSEPAAVLLPVIERPEGLTILLTVRSAGLRHHGGQISLPGGRLEAADADARDAALRETEEEIGLSRRFVEVIGYLPDHLVITGFRVTPVVGFVRPGFALKLDPREVVDAFEMPLNHLLDAAHHSSRRRRLGETEFDVYDIPWGERRIWGATAGILMTLYRTLAK